MNHPEAVALFRQYLLTGDPRQHPVTIEKQAAIRRELDVRLWKQKLAGTPPRTLTEHMLASGTSQPGATLGALGGYLGQHLRETKDKHTQLGTSGGLPGPTATEIAAQRAKIGKPAPAKKAGIAPVTGLQKASHVVNPANLALARACRPGILPGGSEDRKGIHISFNGDFNSALSKFFEAGVEDSVKEAFSRIMQKKAATGTDR